MSGHSKWAQIKHQKAAADQKKGKLFSKLAREIAIAAKSGNNLELVLGRAKALGMNKEAIERAIARGTGTGKEGNIEEIVYEGYGPGGTAFLVEAATSNRNRTASELRHLFSKYGGSLTPPGSTTYLFNSQIPKIELPLPAVGQVKKLIEELENHEDVLAVRTNALL